MSSCFCSIVGLIMVQVTRPSALCQECNTLVNVVSIYREACVHVELRFLMFQNLCKVNNLEVHENYNEEFYYICVVYSMLKYNM